MNKNARKAKNSFELESLEPRVLLSADALLATATLANVTQQTNEFAHQAAPSEHGAFQENVAYQPAAAGGIFDGVSTQAIQSHEPASTPSANQAHSQNVGTVVQAKTTTAAVASNSSSARVSTAAAPISATSTTASGSVATQQLTASLNVANAPPASTTSSQSASNQSVVSNSNGSANSNVSSSSSTVKPSDTSSTVDLFLAINNALNAIATGTTPAPIDLGDVTLGGVLAINGVQINFSNLTISGGAVTAGTVTVTATSASLTNLGSGVTSTIGAITGNYDISTKAFALTLNNVSLGFSSFETVTAASASLTYSGSGTTPVTVTDGTTPTTDSVTLVTIGISDATVFAGLNGPATESDGTTPNPSAVGVELTGANLALALMSDSGGTTYFGLRASAGTLTGVGLPTGFTISSSDLHMDVNGGSGSNVVNFDASFTSATSANGKGLDVSTGSGSVNLDYSQPFLSASGTLELDFNGFVYIHGSMAITSVPTTTVYLTDGTTTSGTGTSVSELLIGASDVTIFAGINGPATNSDGSKNTSAVGVELDNAGFALALFKPTDTSDTSVYYGLMASATNLSGVGLSSSITVGAGDLNVQINGSNNAAGKVVNFDSSFTSATSANGKGLDVATSSSTSVNLDFTGSYVRVAGTLDLGVADYIHISGGFSFTETANEIDINVGSTAFDGAPDLSFVVGPEGSPYFSASGYLSMTITANTFTISTASMTIDSLNIASVLEVDTLTLTISNLSIDLATGDVSGVTDSAGVHDPILTITAASATLFPDSTSFTGSVTATPSGDGLGFQSTFNLSTGAFSVTLEQFHLAIGTTFAADASDVLVTYDPANPDPHQQLVQIGNGTLDFKFGASDITGNVTNLTIYADGFHFDSVTIAYTGSISLGSILTLTNPSVTLTDFGVTFGGSVTETGSLTLSVSSATLNVGSLFSASATNLSIAIALDPADLGNVTITAATVTLQFGSTVSITGSTISINTAPADGGAYLSVGTASVSVSLGSALTLSGTATNFSIINAGGSPQFHEGVFNSDGTPDTDPGAAFGISITATPGQLMLPTWLGFQIQKLEITWADFANHPDQFQLILSASINSIQGLPGGVTVSGEITDAVIDTAKLEAGEFPITSVGSVGGSVSGKLFGMEVNASFVIGVVNLNSDNQIVNADKSITDPTTGVTTPAGSGVNSTIASSTMYVGVAGGAEIPGVGGVQIYIGFSSLGPLTVYLSAEFPLILDPDTGIAIGGFSGGVIFDYTIPTPGQPQDLATVNLSPASITISQWQQQLEMQTITQVAATSAGASAYSQPFVIEAGVTLYDAYLTENAFSITGNLAIQIDPANAANVKIFVTGTATFGDSVSFNADLYLNIDASNPTPTVTVMFLVQEPADLPVETYGGTLMFGFTDSAGNPLTPTAPTTTTSTQTITLADGSTDTYTATTFTPATQTIGGFYISLDGFASFSALGTLTATISGSVTLTVTGTFAKVDLSGDLSVSGLGDLATASGELVVDYSGGVSSLQIYGALKLETGAGLAKLESVGLYVDGAITFVLNTSDSPQTVYLPDPLHPHVAADATEFDITDTRAFEVTMAGTTAGTYATLAYKVGGDTVLNMQGDFDLKISSSGLQMFADIHSLSVGSSATPFLTLSGYGLFVINDQGFAAEMDLSLGAQAITGITLTASFTLVMNTTAADVTYTIPSGLPPVTIPGSDPVVTVTTLTIPRGPPQGLLQSDGTFASVGATGPYIVITGQGDLQVYSFDLSGFFYFQLSDSAAGPVVSLVVSVTGDLGFGTVSVTGGFQLSSAGVVALLEASGKTGSSTDYGNGISLQVTAELAINTTGSDVSSIGGIPLKDTDGNPLTITAGSAAVIASGTLSLGVGGTGFTITGQFSTSTSTTAGVTTATITVNGTLTVTVAGSALLTMSASGVLTATYSGSATSAGTVYGALVLTVGAGNPLSGSGFSFNGSFLLEVNTTEAQQSPMIGASPLMFDGSAVTLAAGQNNSATASDYVQVFAVGTLTMGTASNGFVLVADPNVDASTHGLFLSIGTAGLSISASAKLSIMVGGSSLLTVAASGAMEITSAGLAASLTLTVSGGFGSSGAFSFSGSFTLQINTTNQLINDTVNGVTLALPAGPYFQIAIGTAGSPATLSLGSSSSGLQLSGTFTLTISPAGLAVSANATLNLVVGGHTFFTLDALGALLINSSGGVAAKISLTAGAGSAQPGTSAFSLSLTFILEVNTTGATVSTINGLAVNLGATDAFGNSSYVDIMGTGMLTISSIIKINGTFTFAAGSTGVEMMVSGNVNILGVVFRISIEAGIYSDGIEINAALSLGTGGSVATFVNGLITIDAQFVFQINTSSTTSKFGVATNTAFVLQVHGSSGSGNAKVYVAGFEIDGQLSISISSGAFSATGHLSFNFFGFATVSIDFFFNATTYWFYGTASVRLGSSSFNIHGSLTVVFSNVNTTDPYNGATIHSGLELHVDGGVTAFGYDFASIGADVQISGSSVDISVYVSISFYFFSVGGTVHIHLGSLANTPAPPPPNFGSVSGGVLTLNPTESGDDYEITQNSDGTITLADPSLSSQTQTLSGATSIVINLSSYNDSTVTIDSSVTLPVTIALGGGSNTVTLGNSSSTVTGTTGNDTIHGGSGNVTFTAGSGTSVFIGGGTGSTHNIINDPGSVTVVESGYSSYSLVGTSATAATLTYGGNTDVLSGSSITVALTGAASGAQTFSVSDYSGTATLDAAGNSAAATSITLDTGNLTLDGSTVTESSGTTGTITLQSIDSSDVSHAYGSLNLYGGSAANTFTINSWTGGALTLDGKDGSDTYNINFQSSGSFTATISDSGSNSDSDSVIVNGTTSGSTVNVTSSAVSLGSQTVNYSGIENLTVYTKASSEIVDITGTSAATTINTGSYTDTINVGTNATSGNTGGTLNNVTTTLTVTGNGTDTLNLDDTGDSGANTGTLSAASLTGVLGSGGSLSFSGVQNFNLNLGSGGNTLAITGGTGTMHINSGSGNDTINIQAMNGTMVVNTGIGTNTVNIGSNEPLANGVVKNIKGALTITGGGTTTLNVDDTGDTAAAIGALTGSTITGLNLGASGVTYSAVNTLNISLGSGGNTFTITNTNASTTTTLNSGSGNDTVNLTTDLGATIINAQAGNDIVNVTTDGATTTINGQDGNDTVNLIADTATTNINGGNNNDTINIQSTGATTNVDTGSGTNIINIGSEAPNAGGILDNIQGAVVVTGSGTDTLNVDDTGNTSGRNGASSGLLTSTALTGLGMGASGIAYTGLAYLNISLGSGGNIFNVQSAYSGTVTTVNTGTGTNTVNVANNAPTGSGGILTGIAGELIVNGQGTDTLNVDDTGDANPGTLTETSVSAAVATLKGLGMGASGIQFGNVETLNINLGTHNNTIYIQGNPSVTTFNLNTGAGANNIIAIGSQAGTSITTNTDSSSPNDGNATNTGSVLDYVQGIINITGSGTDTMVVDDSGATTGENGGMWSDKLQFLDPVTINFTGIAAIYISLSEGNDQFVVADTITSASTTPVIVIDGNGGDDTFLNFDTHAVMTVNGGSGDDSFYDFGNSSVLNLNGDAGDDTFYVYASVSENTTNVGPGAADSNGNQIYSYRVNAPVNIDGGSGNDKLFIFGTVLNDVITINGTSVTGAGIDVNYTNIEQLVIAGLGGNDTFYIEAISIPTTIIGDGTIVLPSVADLLAGLGLTLPNLNGNAPPATSFNDTFYVGWQGANYIPGSLAGIQAPLTIYGDNGPNLDGSTTNTPNTTDTIYVDDTGDTFNQNFTLTATTLTSTAMGLAGLINYDGAVENLNIHGGSGENTYTVNGNATAFQTSIYGGPGNDTFIVNDDPLLAPLAIFGESNTFPGDTLIVNGDSAGNDFTITGFTIDGAGATISYQTIEKLIVNAGGATTFTVNGDIVPTYLNGGDANDTFTINSSSAPLYLDGGAGDDTFTINGNSGPLTATGDAGNDSFTVNGNGGSISLSGGDDNDTFIINGNSGSSLVVNGDAGNDSFTVNSLSSPATLNGGSGNDSFTVNEPLAAVLTVNGGGDSGDLLTVNGTIGNDYFTITGTTVSGVGATINYTATNNLTVNGVAGNDTFLILSDSVNTIINGSTGNDLFYVHTTNGPTTINTGGGINVVDIGANEPYPNSNVLDGIQGAVTVNGGSQDVLNIDDSASVNGKTGTLTATTLTGLGMGVGGITYNGIPTLNILLGLGGDTLNIQSVHAGTVTTINTGGGTNTINIGSLAPAVGGIVDNIQGPLIIVGSGSDTLNVDDTGSAGAKTGTLTPTTLTGLGMGASGITYTGFAVLNISLGSGGNTFIITNTNAATVTTLNSGSGADTVNLTTDAGTTTINGQAGNDTINILADRATTNVNGGDDNDTINVRSTGATTNVNTGTGTNTVNVGSLAPSVGGIVDFIQGTLNVTGSGPDTMNVDDTGSFFPKVGILTATTLTGLGMGVGGITYSGLAALNISLGRGRNTFTISNTSAATVTTLNSGSNNDTVNVLADSGLTNINTQGGNDTINIQTTGATTNVNTGAGTNTVNVGSLAPSIGGVVNGIQGALMVTGSGADTMNVDDTGSIFPKVGTLTATTLTGLGMGAGGITYSGLAALNISLGSGGNTFTISSTNAATVTTLNSGSGADTVNLLADSGTTNINGQGGNDTINIQATGATTNVNTGTGTNTVNVGSLAPTLVGGIVDGIQGTLNVTGSGNDTLNVDDTGSTVDKTGTLTATMLTGLGMGAGGITYSGLATLNINLGAGDDTFNVQGTNSTTVNNLNTGTGVNTVNVGSLASSVGGIVNGIQGTLNVTGSGNDTMNVDDTGSLGAKTGTLTATTLTGLGMGAGGITYTGLVVLNISLGSGGNTFTISSTNAATVTTLNSGSGGDTVNLLADSGLTNINTQGGNDTINIQTTGATTNVNTGAGKNTVNVGSLAPSVGGIVDNLQGALIIVGSGCDTLNVDDTGSIFPKVGTLTATALTGLGMGAGGITYSGLATLNISLGSGGNTFNISNTYSATATTVNSGSGDDLVNVLADAGITNINTQGGDDTINIQTTNGTTTVNTGTGTNTVNVGSLAPTLVGGIVDNLQGGLIIQGSGSDTLNVDDTGSTVDKTGTLTSTTLTGLAMGEDGIAYSGLATLNISLGSGSDTLLISSTATAETTVNGNAGDDTFNVQAATGALNLNGGLGDDTFNFGSAAPSTGGTVNNIAGLVTVNGGGNADVVNVDDTGDWTANTGTLTATSLTGLGLGNGINYSAVETLNINLGCGCDTFNVQSTNAITVTTLNTGAGKNTVNVGSLAPSVGGIVDNLQGALIIVGSGCDTLNVDDTGSIFPKVGTLTATALTGLGMGAGGITYSGLATLNISLGSGGNTFTISNTYSATATTVNSGSGDDLVNVLADAGITNINTQGGDDTINIQTTNGTTTVNTGTGTNTVNVGSLAPTLVGGIVDNLQGGLIIQGSGSDTLNVDDTGSTVDKTGTLTSTTLTGLAMGEDGIAYSGLATLNINLGSGDDTFNVQATNAITVTTLNTGNGSNTVNVGSLAPSVGGIVDNLQGGLIIVGSGSDTLNVDDTGSTSDKTGTLTATALTGLGMGEDGIVYSGLSVLNVSLGSGDDTFTINSVSPATAMTIDGGPGTDTANLFFSGSVVIENLTLLNFENTTLYVGGDFTGVLDDSGPISQVTIVGSLTAGSELDASAIGTMTVGGDLAGVVNVTGLLDTLTVDGGTPGEIIAGDINVITVLAGYGNKVLQVIEGGIERQIQATPVGGGDMPDTVHFAFVYDSETAGDPQLAIRITNDDPTARSFNLVLAVINSSTAKFNLSRVDSPGGPSGISNLALQGDLLIQLTSPELQLFTDLTASSPGGVVLPVDSITGVEVSGRLPIGFINVAGIEGLAFSVLTTAAGVPVSLLSTLGSANKPQVLWNLLGSEPVVNAATDAFVVPFNETGSVRLYANDNTSLDLQLVMTLTDPLNDNAPITAYVQIIPSLVKKANPLVQSLAFVGAGASVNSPVSIANITSTGSLGSITISAAAGTTVGGAAGLGNVTATSIFGSINVTKAGIYGIIQTTCGDLGAVTLGTGGVITGVTTIFAQGAITGQIISRGNLISSVKTNGAFTGVIAAQGDIGVIRQNGSGNAVTSTSGALNRFGGISIKGNDSGEIIALGNIFGDVTVGQTMTGRIAAEGQAIAGLAPTRFGILGNITVKSFAAGAAIVSGGLMGDATGKTVISLGNPKGFLAAVGGVNLKSHSKISAASLFQNVSGANLAAINAIFTNASAGLTFDTGGSLAGLGLIETDLAGLRISGGGLTGTTP